VRATGKKSTGPFGKPVSENLLRSVFTLFELLSYRIDRLSVQSAITLIFNALASYYGRNASDRWRWPTASLIAGSFGVVGES
jgi:hypothetical protein